MAKGFEICCLIKAETDNAILLYDYATEIEAWVPLSQVEEVHRTTPARVVMSEWIAQTKGFLD